MAHRANVSCGDAIDLYVRLSPAGTVERASFTGVGCVISLAASSLFTEYVQGRTSNEILALGEPDMVRLVGTDIAPLRLGCATLPLLAFKKGYEIWKRV